MSGPPPDLPPGGRSDAVYTAALQLARRRGLQLTQSALAKLETAIRNALHTILPSVTDQALRTPLGAATLRAKVREALDEMERSQQAITQHATTLVITDVTAIHRQATITLLSSVGVDATTTGLGSVPARVLAILAERPRNAASFVTLIKRGMQDVGPEVDRLLSAAIARGVDAETIARDLRTILNGGTPIDLRRTYGLSEAQTADARSVAYDARRIAVSETNNALREANRQSLLAGGIVEAAKWQLSGRHSVEDECVPGDTLIRTIDGDVPARDVVIGTLVLTHRGRYQPVTRLYRHTIRAGSLVRLSCRAENSRTLHLRLTPNHPVLSDRGWTPAGALRTGMRVHYAPELPAAYWHQCDDDTRNRARRGSVGNAPSAQPGTGACSRCGASQGAPSPSTSHMTALRARVPMSRIACGDGIALSFGHPANSGCLARDATAKTVHECSQASSIYARTGMSSSRTGVLPPACAQTVGRTARTPAVEAASPVEVREPGARRTDVQLAHTDQNRNDAPSDSASLTSLPRSNHTCVPFADRDTHHCTAGCRTAGEQPALRLEAGEDHRSRESAQSSRRIVNTPSSYMQSNVVHGVMPHTCIDVIERIPVVEMAVYNFSVDEDQSYIADDIVVHNCDDLAETDFYGYGPGYYPIPEWPMAPHPLCACTQGGPVIYRPVEDWGTPNTAETALRATPSDLAARPAASPLRTARRQRVLTAALARTAHSGGPERPRHT